MKAILVNYNFTPEWLLTSDLDYLIYDRSDTKDWLKDFPQERIIYTQNIGNVDYDKLTYLIENYDSLPDIFLWGKTNLFKYINTLEKEYSGFTPLLKEDHKVYSDKFGPVCFYENGIYHERNDSWYFSNHYGRYVNNFSEWARTIHLKNPAYIPFAPGGNYILTKEVVHHYGRDYYDTIRQMLDWTDLPVEAQCAERSYYLIWSSM